MELEIKILPKTEGESQAEYAYRILRKNIMEFSLPPGCLLNEGELAGFLSISRTPIHEAVNRLKEELLIDVIPRKESKVSKIKISLINEGITLRCAVEPRLVEMIAGNLPQSVADTMRQNLEVQTELLQASKEELYKFYPVDDEFHRMIYVAANKYRIYDAVNKVVTHLDRMRYLIRHGDEFDIEKISYDEHRELYNMMMLGVRADFDLDLFYRRHITRFQNVMEEVIHKFPDYFDYS